jgi:hypothetical protein
LKSDRHLEKRIIDISRRRRQLSCNIFDCGIYPGRRLVVVVTGQVNLQRNRLNPIRNTLPKYRIDGKLSDGSWQGSQYLQFATAKNADVGLLAIYFLPYILAENTKAGGASRDGASPDLTVLSSSWTVHFHESGSMPCTSL